MAIDALTGFKAFVFDGVKSTDYGVQIYGEGVFNAPERAVEYVKVPGRNGSIVLDQGYYENIEVTYPANIIARNTQDFADAIASFRNALCSRKGYCRLTDDYHPGEYRMAVYSNGLEVDEKALRTGEFEITFNCQPQRYLLSGEAPISVDSGDTIYNPTPHASNPLIAVEGPGRINLGDQPIQINDVVVGTVNVSDKITLQNQSLDRTWDINESKYNSGDLVTIPSLTMRMTFTITNNAVFLDTKNDRTMGIEYYNTVDSDATLSYNKSGKVATYGVTLPSFTLTIGQSFSRIYRVRATVIVEGASKWQSNRMYLEYSVNYANGVLKIYADRLIFNVSGVVSEAAPRESCTISLGAIVGESTLSTLTDTIYLDCEIGDAYVLKNGEYVSLNSTVEFGSDLPVLPSGETEVTYEDTITALSITPRWWIL